MGWNYGDILDGLADVLPPEKPALIHADTVISWQDFTAQTNRLARALATRGVGVGDKVAFYLRNSPAYSQLLGACFKGRFTHVNVNYRYVEDELVYIIDNSDSTVVAFDEDFADRIVAIRSRLPNVKVWLQSGSGTRPDFAEDFAHLLNAGDGSPLGITRSADDLLFLYTGGTTGMPKGVMWRHEDQWLAGAAGANAAMGGVRPATLAAHLDNVKASGGGGRTIPCCPLMHGTGLFTAMGTLGAGGTIVTLTGQSFTAEELWDTVDRHKVNGLAIVGDAFAKPMLRCLEENPERWDISSLASIISSGVMWSPEVKRGLLRHNRNMVLTDSFGASEAVGFGRSDTTADGTTEVAKFKLGENCKVFDENFEEVPPGSGRVGFVARSGPLPMGYYKDPEKTAKTFPTIRGVRYSIPGDYCQVEADGTLILLGRGSVCINTAGEKVYPEEIEEVLKTHPAVADALVVGVADDKWGQAVTGVIHLEQGANFDEADIRAHVRQHLAGYKTPKRILVTTQAMRASNGKADYKGVRQFAEDSINGGLHA
ncbi:MAG: acyl-CoA synthetase [Pseudomonadales bacterium]|nr:acyl-CoA synthetase [Pseudomonadales bacterium]MCP5184562.1 acyl-CoA synthetase [Pseudomonadales bacterium]